MFELFITTTIYVSLWTTGLRLITEDARAGNNPQLLNPIRRIAVNNLPPALHKPLISCVTCMASVHGSMWLAITEGITIQTIPLWFLIMAASAFIGTILWEALERIRTSALDRRNEVLMEWRDD